MSRSGSPTAIDWSKAFSEVDDCPWPGPKPLGDHDEQERVHLLVGRDEDIRRIRQEISQDIRLLLLAGESGVGKSSLLRAGIVPILRSAGNVVAVCSDWSGLTADPAASLAAKVAEALGNDGEVSPADGKPLLDDGRGSLFWDLDEIFGGRIIIVLDQFEELVRHTPLLADAIFDLLLELNRHTRIKLIISFRSEYLYSLRRLENEASPFTISRYILSEVDPSFAEAVIEAGNLQVLAIEPGATKKLAKHWRQARDAVRDSVLEEDPFGRVGLLHLQAALYSLHEQADGGVVKERHVTAHISAGDPAQLFRKSLIRAVDIKLDRCRRASMEIGLSGVLVASTAAVVANIVPHLSSSGYKLVREAQELAGRAIGEQLETLSLGARDSGADPDRSHSGDGAIDELQLKCLFDVVLGAARPDRDQSVDEGSIDLVGDDRSTIAAEADRRFAALEVEAPVTPWIDRFHPDLPPWVRDTKDVTCGILSGSAPAEALIEELRHYGFALVWLERSSLVRITSTGRNRMMVSLIHDGFGAALRKWAGEAAKGPAGEIAAVTSRRGPEYIWQIAGDEPIWPEFLGEGQAPKVLQNLSWRGGIVRAAFKHVVFVNCDFRGTFFSQCVFEGVAFVNCLLDGVMFSDSKVLGHLEPYDGPRGEVERTRRGGEGSPVKVEIVDGASDPVFRIPVTYSDQGTRVVVGGDAVNAAQIHSHHPGLPATPYSGALIDFTSFRTETGGLVIYGGRISSVVFRNIEIEGEQDDEVRSRISLRHAAGSGLDFVESRDVRLDVFGSAIRNLTVTPEVTTRILGGSAGVVGATIDYSVLSQLWVSEGLSGLVVVVGSFIAQAWNASPAVEVLVENSPGFFSLVNAKTDIASHGIDGDKAVSKPTPGLVEFGALSRPMDYRRNPAKTIGEAPETSEPIVDIQS